jgi:hypothetical protein
MLLLRPTATGRSVRTPQEVVRKPWWQYPLHFAYQLGFSLLAPLLVGAAWLRHDAAGLMPGEHYRWH